MICIIATDPSLVACETFVRWCGMRQIGHPWAELNETLHFQAPIELQILTLRTVPPFIAKHAA